MRCNKNESKHFNDKLECIKYIMIIQGVKKKIKYRPFGARTKFYEINAVISYTKI